MTINERFSQEIELKPVKMSDINLAYNLDKKWTYIWIRVII